MYSILFRMSGRFITAILLSFVFNFSHAQPPEQFIKVVVSPDHADWTYKTGENVKFTITVLQNGNALKNAVVKSPVDASTQLASTDTTIRRFGSQRVLVA